eukprot:9091962-Prorocentrum_lima.AAC.1
MHGSRPLLLGHNMYQDYIQSTWRWLPQPGVRWLGGFENKDRQTGASSTQCGSTTTPRGSLCFKA